VLKAPEDPGQLAALLKALGDPIRLRILGVLAGHELSVGDLSRTLGLAQSRVSNHLRVIRKFQLLEERHVGSSTFLEVASNGSGGLGASLWAALRPGLETMREHAEDLARLRSVLEERHRESREFFDRVAGDWDAIGVDFTSGQARQRVAAGFLPPDSVIADLGCGTGYVAQAFLGLARKVICVDRSLGMLDQARKRLEATSTGTEVELRPGDLDSLPIADDEVDGAVCAMILHHLPDPLPCLMEVFRVVRPGGTAAILELAPHRREWMHDSLGDRHLGLEPSEITSRLELAGFVDLSMEVVDDGYGPTPPGEASSDSDTPLSLYILRGRVPRRS
jgi:ubiquinone/menaquinone biosynthesis C-methylase UbiE